MNKVIMMGRLTRDPETRYGAGATGTSVSRFSIAVDRRFKREGEPEADFFNWTAFGKQAEFIEKYLKKGTKVVLEGSVQNDNYTNKEGQKVYGTRIMVENIEFAESKAASEGSGASYNGGSYGKGGQDSAAPSGAPEPSGFMPIPSVDDEGLPFGS